MKIKEFGIIADGQTIETQKIQNAIDECSKRGEVLIFDQGIYKTGTLFLQDNSKIILEKGAVISGIPSPEFFADYGGTFVDAVNIVRGKALLVASGVKNIEISGEGKICGNGGLYDKKLRERPFLVRFVNCENIRISDVTMMNSISWCFHIDKCKDVRVNSIKVYNRCSGNNDGIDIDSSEDVLIENCDVSTEDDAVCLKSTSQKSCKNIHIKNCRISSDCAGFKIGTESVGDFENVVCEDCEFYDVYACGIKITLADGAVARDIKIKNVKMRNCTGPIFVSTSLRNREYAGAKRQTPSKIINLQIENLKADVIKGNSKGTYNIGIDGGKPNDPEEYLKTLYDYGGWCEGLGGIIISGSTKEYVENIILKNMDITLPGGFMDREHKFKVREMGSLYPEYHRFDPVPAKGIYIRHAKNVSIENVNFTYKQEDIRQEIYTEDAQKIKLVDGKKGDYYG